ncbi:MAG: PASTA domain-containing protein [Gemmatimonadaceae bacterium]
MNWRGRFRKSLVYLVSIVAGFTLAYLLVAFVVFPSGVIPRDVKVPNVTGLGFDEASQRLAQAGFKSEQGEQRFNNSAPKMTVLEQSPPPGSREGIGATVTLVVSGGQRMVAIPVVTGMTKIEAQVLLEKQGFDVGEVTETSSNAPRGSVIATRPAGGSAVSVPSAVSLVLSGGPAAQMMPDLMGRDVGGARQLLTQLGVKSVQVINDPTGPGAPGTIVGQTPVSGATIPAGTAVQLRVVSEPPPLPPAAPAPAPEPRR